jgi:hypothetical protein
VPLTDRYSKQRLVRELLIARSLLKSSLMLNNKQIKNLSDGIYAFLQQQEDSEGLFKHVKALDQYINVKKTITMRQTTIDQFF